MTETLGADPFVAQLAGLCRAHLTRAKWVIVSSHAVGHALAERLAREGTNWANLRFKTPFDLALEIAAPFLVERGIDPLGEDLGPALIMRLLTGLPPGVEPYFRHLGAHHEMGAALWSSIRELRLAGIGASDLPADAFASAAKHAELQALIAAYEEWLAAEHKADPAAVFAEARLRANAAPIRAADLLLELPNVIWPPLVRAFLDALPGDRLIPAVPRIPSLTIPRRVQGLPREECDTASTLASLMQPDSRTHAARVSRPANAGLKARATASESSLRLFRAGGAEAEIEEVFRRILHAEGGPLPLDQVEIACASPDYPFLVWQKAQRYGWPVTLGPGIPITATRPARALLAWCDWIEAGYPASGLRRLLQSGDIRLDIPDGPGPGHAARLLLTSEATWGRRTYANSLAALAAAEREQAENPELDPDKQAARLKRATHAKLLGAWIDALLAALPDPDAVSIPFQSLLSAARDFVAHLAATANELDGKAARAVDTAVADLRTLGSIDCPPSYALDLIRAAIDGVTVGADRARPGHLHVSALARAGTAGRPHAFVVGLEEGRVLPALVEDPVLLDVERTRIAGALATSADRAAESVHAIVSRLVLLAQPRGSLCLSFSCRDLREYRETFPSWLMLQAYRVLQPGAEVTYNELNAFLGEPTSMAPAAPDAALGDAGWWLAGLKQVSVPNSDPVLNAFPSLGQGASAEQARASDAFTIYDGLVQKAGALLDPRTSGRPVSPTKLEKAAACPFRFFLESGLGLDAIEEDKRDADAWLDPATRGSLLHALYADMMRELRRLGQTADPRRHLTWLHGRADERLAVLKDEMPPPTPEIFEHERQGIHRDLELFLEFEAEAADRLAPIAFEANFGSRFAGAGETAEPLGQLDPIEVSLGDARFSLCGRIDRIDRADRRAPHDYLVTDYKTGSYYRPVYQGIFHGGRLLQHVLYAIAADRLLKTLDPKARVVAGRYYFPSTKGGGEEKLIARPTPAQVAEVLSDLFETIRAGAFTTTAHIEDCKYCDYGRACGAVTAGDVVITRAQLKAEATAHRTLDPFRRLRSHA
jgi:ATP-dependent helicase/nuclease subunit B